MSAVLYRTVRTVRMSAVLYTVHVQCTSTELYEYIIDLSTIIYMYSTTVQYSKHTIVLQYSVLYTVHSIVNIRVCMTV